MFGVGDCLVGVSYDRGIVVGSGHCARRMLRREASKTYVYTGALTREQAISTKTSKTRRSEVYGGEIKGKRREDPQFSGAGGGG